MMSLVLILPLSFRLLRPVVSWSTPFGCIKGISNLRCSTKKFSFSPPKSAPPLNTPFHPQPSRSSNQEFRAIFNSVLSFIPSTPKPSTNNSCWLYVKYRSHIYLLSVPMPSALVQSNVASHLACFSSSQMACFPCSSYHTPHQSIFFPVARVLAFKMYFLNINQTMLKPLQWLPMLQRHLDPKLLSYSP